MPSSYTTSLRLTLPATGELTGTWGTTVNTGITELLDSAVAGTTTISTWGGAGVPYTLSNTDGAADEARKMFIVATGAPGEAKNVICPAVSKLYFFRNDTTGGFALTLKTSGGSGIAVPAGQYKVLYCNGTNVVEAFNSLASLTLGTALAASSGGTGQSTYTVGDLIYASGTTTLSKLGIGTNGQILTSTGTAPQWSTLSGVAVTTFSAGTTGFTPSTATSGAVTLGGTLATTNGGTGLTSFTANRVFYSSSTSAIGQSANLTFDGTTLTANALNLSGGTANGVLYLDGSKVATSGSALTFDPALFGLGISAPTVIGNQAATGTAGTLRLISAGGVNYIQSGQNTTTASAAPLAFTDMNGSGEWMRLTSTGLGIGTSSPDTKLTVTVADAVTSTRFKAATGIVRFRPYVDATSGALIDSTNAAESAYLPLTLTASTLRLFGNNGTGATIDSSGNLGIGTSSPAYKLDVAGSARFTNGEFLYFNNSSGTAKTVLGYFSDNNTYLDAADGAIIMRTGSGTVERMRLDASGNLGLGVTPSAWSGSFKAIDFGSIGSLTTNGAASIIGSNFFVNSGSSLVYKTTAAASYFQQQAGAFAWFTAPSGTAGNAISFTQAMTLDASGNLGIGTSSPVAKLDVNGNQSFSTASFIIGYGLNTQTGTIAGATSPFYGLNMATFTGFSGQGIGLHGYYGLLFSTTGTERMRLDSSGNLGIGTSSPGAKLDVFAGAIRSTVSTGGTLLLGDSNNTTAIRSIPVSGDSGIGFYTQALSGNSLRMTIDSSGNLGIGTSSPSTIGVSGYTRLVLGTGSSATEGLTIVPSGTGGIQFTDAANTQKGFVQWDSSTGALAFGTAATERMRLDSSGNLGLGVTPSAWGGGAKTLDMTSTGSFEAIGANSTSISYNRYYNGTNNIYKTTGSAGIYALNSSGQHVWYNAPSGTAGNTISFTQAMTLDASGNLGVGTTGPSTRLHVEGGATTEVRVVSSGDLTSGGVSILRLGGSNSATSAYVGYGGTSSTIDLWNTLAGAITFGTNNTERARITSGGDFYVGTANALTAAGKISVAFDQASAYGLILRNTNATATSIFVSFENSSGGSNGNISQTNSTTVAYNTSSDRRLKKDIAPAPQAGADIDAIEVVSHGWVSNDDVVKYGVVAQDLHAVAPQAVSAGDDGDEIERTWGVDYSKLVPMLIKEIQSLRARVAALESQP